MTRSGIDIIGEVPWGTHFCQFYNDKQDLIEILVPYFREGLLQNEFCMWIASEPLHVDDAKAALQTALPDLDDYIRRGQIEILDYSQWYTASGKFNAESVLKGWIEKEQYALQHGYEGLRLSGNTFWLEKADWNDFSEYEAAINDVIGSYRMIAACTYCLQKCDAYELLDVVSNHQFAVIKQSGQWTIIQSHQQRKAELALKESEDRYRSLVENSPFAIGVHREGKYIYVNPTCAKLFGASHPDEIIGRDVLDFVPPDSRQVVNERIQLMHTTGAALPNRDSTIIRSDGKQIYVSVSGKVLNFEGQPAALVVFQDNTERRLAEEALRKAYNALGSQIQEKKADLAKTVEALGLSERRYRSLTLATTEIVWTTNAIGEVVDDMPTWRVFTGQSEEQIKGWGWSDAVHPDDRDRVISVWNKSTKERKLYEIEYRLRRYDGFYRLLSVRGVPVLDDNGAISEWIGTCIDITEQKHLEVELHNASLYARNLIEASLDPLITISSEGKVTDVNNSTELVTGLNKDSLIGSDFSTYFTDPEKAKQGYLKVLSDGFVKDYPLTIRHSSGTTTDVLYNATIYKNQAGEVQGIFAAARDITEHRKMDEELHRLHKALEHRATQLQVLASELTLTEQRERRRLAQLLHDHLQQLLYAARLGLTTLKRRIQDNDSQNMLQNFDMLLAQCIDESRSLTIELSPPVLYDAGLASALEWLARQSHTNYNLTVEVSADAKAEPDTEDIKVLLFHSVRELLFNVVKHSATRHAKVSMRLADDNFIRIDVIDNGSGFDPECLKSNGHNFLGFGLFSIRERLEQMGGQMVLHTALGEGTSVSILAPINWQLPSTAQGNENKPTEDYALNISPEYVSVEGHLKKIRILLADDHAVLRKGLAGVLNQETDIEVIAEAADGEMAVELTKKFKPDVVLMDVTMPKVDGIEATRRITAAQSGVDVIGFSAHKEEDMAKALYKAGAVAYLSKDESAEFLIAAIRNIYLKKQTI